MRAHAPARSSRSARGAAVAPGLLALALATGCAPSPEPVSSCSDGAPLARPLVVLETDYAASGLARVGTDRCVVERGSLLLGTDPALAAARGRLFVAARAESRLLEVAPATGLLVDGRAWDVGAAADRGQRQNPQDVAIDDAGRLWVPRYDRTSLAILGPDGAYERAVDLAALADADGYPEMTAIAIRGGEAFVVLERLTRTDVDYVAAEPARIAVVDVASGELRDGASFDLAGRNPFGRFVDDPDDAEAAWLAAPGSFLAIDAGDGIERVDLAGRTSRVVVPETALGGSPMEIAIASRTEGWALVASPDRTNATALVRFDPSTGAVGAPLARTEGYDLSGLAIDGDLVLVGDRDRTAPRVRAFAREGGAEQPPVALGLLPPLTLFAP